MRRTSCESKNTEIAEKLGISKTAVSLAINNKPGVSEETRQKVLKMISDSLADTVPSAGKSTVSSGSYPAQRSQNAREGHKR